MAAEPQVIVVEPKDYESTQANNPNAIVLTTGDVISVGKRKHVRIQVEK